MSSREVCLLFMCLYVWWDPAKNQVLESELENDILHFLLLPLVFFGGDC
jgi:hypothetical protein